MNIVSVLEENARLFANSIAIIDDATGKMITYQELWRQINAVSKGLISVGVREADRVALCLPNGAEFIIVYCAALKIGAIAVPFNILLTYYEIEDILKNSGAKVFVGTGEHLDKLISHRELFPELKIFIEAGHQHQNEMADINLERWLGGDERVETVLLRDEQPAAIHYTSGTTGKMKGAVLSHKNLETNAKINGHYVLGLNDQDIVLGVSPFCHVYFVLGVLGPLYVGASIVTVPRSSPSLALAAIEKYKVTHFISVPTMFRYLLEKNEENSYDLSSIRVVGSGASNSNPDLIDKIQSLFNADLYETYGCTEASSTIAYTRLRHYKLGSVGLPSHLCSVRLVNDNQEEVSAGEVGEVLIKGPGVFTGYWGEPELTRDAFTPDGWFKTGDLAYRDEEGYLYIVGRSKDVINSGGYNVYPKEIEEVLLKHSAVSDAVVVGRFHKNLNEVPVAYIILKPGATANEEDIIDHCHKRLAKYKVPKAVEFVTEFPLNAVGKVQKDRISEKLYRN